MIGNSELAVPQPGSAASWDQPPEHGRLSNGLDYYKPTMSQLAYEHEPDAEVTFTFHNRGQERLLDYIQAENLQQRFDALRSRGWDRLELAYLARVQSSSWHPVFSDQYLLYLQSHGLPEIRVTRDEETDDLAIATTGPWALATFWETIVMSEVSEAYFEGYLQAHGIDPLDVYDEGDRRLSEKIAILQENPDIKFADFGTRRRFSLQWQRHVIRRLLSECPQNFVGTSNVGLAHSFNIRPIGTFAHEMPMVYAGLADARGEDIRDSHHKFLQDWFDRYGTDYSIALTDTFGTDFFFADFTPQEAAAWRGVRQDSGDPIVFGEHLIEFYKAHGIDPTTKTVVFSDGLDIDAIVALQQRFGGRINVLFGWGTTLTNDLGMRPLNVVMKATHVRVPATGQEADTVKLSDSSGKHLGPAALVNEYQQVFSASTSS